MHFGVRKKTIQGCEKKMYPKLVVNKLKVMGNSMFIYIDWALSSRKFSKKLPTYMWPMLPMCVHEHPCVPM